MKTQNLLFYKAELQFMANDLAGVRLHRRGNAQGRFPRSSSSNGSMRESCSRKANGTKPARHSPSCSRSWVRADRMPTRSAMQLGLAYEKSGQLDKAEIGLPERAARESEQ